MPITLDLLDDPLKTTVKLSPGILSKNLGMFSNDLQLLLLQETRHIFKNSAILKSKPTQSTTAHRWRKAVVAPCQFDWLS